MNKYCFVFLAWLMYITMINAQSFLGPVAGISLSKYNQLPDEPGYQIATKYKSGISIGVALEMEINDPVVLQAELRFTQMGSGITYSDATGSGEATEYLNYMCVPLLVKYKLGTEVTKFFFEAGPRIGFGLGNITDESYGNSTSMTFADAEFKTFDYGLVIGGGAAFQAGTGSMFLDARYYLGLQNVNQRSDQPGVKNKGISINVGFLFPMP